MKKKNPVVHFEMPGKDMNRMTNFYEMVFGWETKQLGPEMGNYVTVTTTELDEHNCPKTVGSINGGFFPITDDRPSPSPSVVIAVDNVNDVVKGIVEAGGKIIGQPTPIPGIGTYATFLDTEGNVVSILQPWMG